MRIIKCSCWFVHFKALYTISRSLYKLQTTLFHHILILREKTSLQACLPDESFWNSSSCFATQLLEKAGKININCLPTLIIKILHFEKRDHNLHSYYQRMTTINCSSYKLKKNKKRWTEILEVLSCWYAKSSEKYGQLTCLPTCPAPVMRLIADECFYPKTERKLYIKVFLLNPKGLFIIG